MESVFDLPLITYARARSVGYVIESQALHFLSRVLLRERATVPKLTPQQFALIQNELKLLIEKDSANIRNGLYPLSVLKPESPVKQSSSNSTSHVRWL